MINNLLKSAFVSSLLIAIPLTVNADTQSTVTTSSNYETLTGSMSNYAFPNGHEINVYPSLKIGVPLSSDDYTFTSTKEKSLSSSNTQIAYVLKATASGQDKINQAISKISSNYKLSDASQTIMGQFENHTSKNGTTKYFTTGITTTNSTSNPNVTDVMFIATFTSASKSINSQNQLSSIKKETSKDQASFQNKIGKLSKAQLKIINPASSTLSVKSNAVNTNTDVKTAQSESKTKIVNLEALKQAQYADKVNKQKATAKRNHKIATISLIAAVVSIIAILIATSIYFIKHKKRA